MVALPATSPQLILASASPRRRELLAALGARFVAVATDAEEQETPTPPSVLAALPALPLSLAEHPTLRAWRKAAAVVADHPGAVVLAADTVVVIDGAVLNKPADAAHAQAMLATLSGRTHTVYTGLCVLRRRQIWLDVVASAVEFYPLGAEAIVAYIATGESMDKAGAYGLQGLAGQFVRVVRGSYTNVVGMPLSAVSHLLGLAGVDALADPAATFEHWLQRQGKEPPPCPPTFP